LASKRTVAAFAIRVGFLTLCGIVNYQRWGDALKFADFRAYIIYTIQSERLAHLTTYGVFNKLRPAAGQRSAV
jgi:hypothetical protein